MKRTINRTTLVELISNQTGVNAEQVIDTANFIDDLGCDSLDIIETIMELESELDIEINEDSEAVQNGKTVGDMIAALKAAGHWEGE